jgi:hypothetical protein
MLTDGERELLLRQIKTIEGFDDKILKTVHWALGAVFAVAALLVGYGWFTNFKMGEKDRQRLKEETLNDANKSLLQMRAEIEKAVQTCKLAVPAPTALAPQLFREEHSYLYAERLDPRLRARACHHRVTGYI